MSEIKGKGYISAEAVEDYGFFTEAQLKTHVERYLGTDEPELFYQIEVIRPVEVVKESNPVIKINDVKPAPKKERK